jgi:broad specificity phosphatase PhoE
MKNDLSLFFVRHGKLTLPYKDHSEMPLNVLADLASLKLNPPIDKEFALQQLSMLDAEIPFRDIEKVYNSPSLRCQETAKFLSEFISKSHGRDVEPVIAEELKEIKFDLLKLLPHSNESNFEISSLNETVLRGMAEGNKYCESAQDAYGRIGKFINSNIDAGPTLFVTHDFIMRIIETYIRNKGEADHKVTYGDLKNTKRNLYLQGFATDSSFNKFVPI